MKFTIVVLVAAIFVLTICQVNSIEHELNDADTSSIIGGRGRGGGGGGGGGGRGNRGGNKGNNGKNGKNGSGSGNVEATDSSSGRSGNRKSNTEPAKTEGLHGGMVDAGGEPEKEVDIKLLGANKAIHHPKRYYYKYQLVPKI